MLNTKHILTLSSAMVLTLSMFSPADAAENVSELDLRDRQVKAYSKTTEQRVVETVPATSLFNYDMNGNGTLEPNEVGTKLFYQFDRDGNQSLDNIEFRRKLSVKFEPIEKTKILTVDYNNDGILEAEKVETEIVMKRTGLDRFGNDRADGISPREFIGKSLLQLDVDGSGLVELREWRNAYIEQMAPKAANNRIYN